jgi:hypothetical protein
LPQRTSVFWFDAEANNGRHLPFCISACGSCVLEITYKIKGKLENCG